MNICKYESDLFIGGQICAADFPTLVKMGIRTIICNRPNGEDKNQLDYEVIQKISAQHNIATYYLPVTSTTLNDSHITKMASLLHQVQRPLFAYCRSGSRSKRLCALAGKMKKESC